MFMLVRSGNKYGVLEVIIFFLLTFKIHFMFELQTTAFELHHIHRSSPSIPRALQLTHSSIR